MVRDATWVRAQLEKVRQKRALLQMLEDKLAAWDTQASFIGISPAKSKALLGLSNESKTTIKAMMHKVSGDIRSILEGMKYNNA